MKGGDKEKIDYHSGFYAAMRIEFNIDGVDFSFSQEVELGDKPVRLDMLIINNADKNILKDPIGKFFRKYNVLEYKSPADKLSVDDFYKVQAYACLYKSLGNKVNERRADELTVSIFRHVYPEKMFEELKRLGLEIEEACPGIYRVTGAVCIPAQVVVASRLDTEGYETFKTLVKNARREDLKFVFYKECNEEDKEALLRVTMALNPEFYESLKGDKKAMEILRKLFQEELMAERDELLNEGRAEGLNEGFVKGRNETRNEDRKNFIKQLISIGWSPEKAADFVEGALTH